MVLSILLVACLILAASLSVLHFRRSSGADRFLRFTAFANPLLAWFLLAHIVRGLLLAPQDIWNDIHLARAFSLLHGYKLYYGPSELGPVYGAIHPPVSHLAYIWLGFLHRPTTALIAGSAVSQFLVVAVLLWFHLRLAPARRTLAVFAFFIAALAATTTPGISEAVRSIHADALSIVFATLAAGTILSDSPRRLPWIASALCAVLSIWTKQTLAPIVVPLLAFACFRGGFAACARYLLYLVASALGVSLCIFGIFWPPSRLLFNIVTLAAHKPFPHPWIPAALAALRGIAQTYQVLFFAVACLAVYVLFFPRDRQQPPENISLAPALLCFGIFFALLPGSFAAEITINGAPNDLGACMYFLVLSLTACLATRPASQDGFTSLCKVVLTVVALWSLHPLALAAIRQSYRELRSNPTQLAYNYIRLHGDAAYFPYNPLASLLAEGKIYHLDEQLYDRAVAGYPVTPAQLRSGLPAHFTMLAIPPTEELQSSQLRDQLRSFSKVDDPAFAGWTIYRTR